MNYSRGLTVQFDMGVVKYGGVAGTVPWVYSRPLTNTFIIRSFRYHLALQVF